MRFEQADNLVNYIWGKYLILSPATEANVLLDINP
jgi:hypothetical protein